MRTMMISLPLVVRHQALSLSALSQCLSIARLSSATKSVPSLHDLVLLSNVHSPPTVEKMRWCFTISLLSIAISILLLLLRSFDVHLSRDLIHGNDASSLPHSGAVASLNATLFHCHNLAIRKLPRPPSRRFPPLALVSILFPDWEAFLLLPLPSSVVVDRCNLSCLFHNGAVSPAGFVRILPTSLAG